MSWRTESAASDSREVESANDRYAIEHPHGDWHVASAASVTFKADPIAVVVYNYGSKISDEPTFTVFGPFGGWNEARDYRDKIRAEREPMCVVMRDPSIWPEPEKAL